MFSPILCQSARTVYVFFFNNWESLWKTHVTCLSWPCQLGVRVPSNGHSNRSLSFRCVHLMNVSNVLFVTKWSWCIHMENVQIFQTSRFWMIWNKVMSLEVILDAECSNVIILKRKEKYMSYLCNIKRLKNKKFWSSRPRKPLRILLNKARARESNAVASANPTVRKGGAV